ncbi:MAG: hypothetical protein KKB30_06720 [Proteobacteria bacterium]|nr:hypothetical protein [Pseudomonadota bacterium]MBU1715410.1 hypothetical protein [Pseudomonadota bacterium]
MRTIFSELLTNDIPWQFRILTILVFLLVSGGLALDLAASKVANPVFQQYQEDTKDEKTGAARHIEHLPLDKEDKQLLVELSKSKSDNLNKSAQLLYDFAKIALGALIASITNVLGNGQAKEPDPPPVLDPNTNKS